MRTVVLRHIGIGLAALGLVVAYTTSSASANVVSYQTFDSDPAIGATQAPGVWYTDRFAPAGFSSQDFAGDKRLALELSTNDSQNNRPAGFSSAFYNTQGRKFDTPGAIDFSVDFYIDTAFQVAQTRIGGMWATAIDDSNNITAFPIIEFHSTGAGGNFAVWTGSNFVDVGLPTGFAWDTFANMRFRLVGTAVEYFVNGELVFTNNSVGASTSFANVILQGINVSADDFGANGVTRTLYFDNFKALAVVPIPAALPMLGAAVVGLGFLGWRRRPAA